MDTSLLAKHSSWCQQAVGKIMAIVKINLCLTDIMA